MKRIAPQDFAGLAGLQMGQSPALARRQATGAAALAIALAAFALVAALRAEPDFRSAGFEQTAASALAVSARSIAAPRGATN